MSHVYRRPYPAYYWAPTNVEAQPIWEEPYCYREAKPQEWGYGNYGGPYWYYHQPGKDGYSYYGPKYEDWDPRYYEGNAKDFRGDFGRGFGRYLRPVYVYPPPPTAAASGPFAFRPFHPGDQFRHPDEYPMRFVPVAYGSASDPCEKEQVKPHCCGCPNHVCHPETRAVKGVERKGLMDRTAEEDVKTKTQNMQDLAGPVVCFNPLEWHGKASENKNRNEGKEEHPVYWIPVNWNRNDGDKEQERWFPGNSVPLDMNSKPLGWGEDKNKLPGYWIPLESSRRPQGWEEHKKKSQFEGNENKNKFPGYWIPLDSIVRPQGEQKDKENSLFEGKSHPFPVLWIPEENLKMASSQEGMKNGGLENRPALVQNVEKEDEKQRVMEEVPVEQIEKGNLKMEGTKNGGLEKEREKINESGTRPVTVQEVGEVNEKQRPQEARKETKVRGPVKQLEEEKSADVQKAKENVMEVKARDIPVKQLEKDKSARVEAQARKAEEKVAENHKVSSPRASKLPPVCLRVDPLPGKRKTNGKSSSRSPSPPKKDNDFTANASTQNIKPGASKIPVESKKAEENASVKASKVAGETKKDDDNASLRASKLGDETKKAGENAYLKNSMLNGELEKVDQNLDVQSKNGGNRKTELSRDEAALKIQATYRGCQVRKLEPLRKLHEIAKIRHRMEELKQQIMSPEFEGELSRDDKTRAKMNETLMGLLLQLDTIQGLHPVVRDVRKSLARELVQLQEKLDTLVEGARSSNLQPCMIYETENNVASVEEKNDKDKCLDATEDSCNTLLGTSSENQEVEIEITKDEIAQEKGTVKQDSLEIENAVSNGGKECVFALKNDDSKEETVNTIINDSENVEDNAPVQQEALKVSGNLEIEIPSLSIHLQSEDTTNQDENLANERKSLVISEEMISTVNDAVEPLHNVTMEKEDKSESALEILPAEKEKKSEPNSLKKQDSPLPSVVDKEICPLSSLAQEQEAEDSDSLNASDDNANTLQKNATLEQGGEVMVIGPEAEASDSLNASDDNANTLQKNATLEQGGEEMVIGSEAEKSKPSPEKDSVDKEENSEAELLKEPNSALPPAVEKDTCKASNQVQKHKVAASDNLNYLEENAITLEKNATLEQGSKMMLIEAEAEKSEPSLEKISVEKGGKSEPNNLEKNSTLEQGGKVMVIGSEAEMSKPSPKNDSVDKDENFEADNLKEPNSALPPAVEIDTCKASTQVQEHEVAASENLNYLDKNATMEQGGKMTLIEAEKSEPSLEIISIEEGEKSEPNNLDEPDSALSLAVEKEICPDNSNTMDGNINVSDKNASLDPEGKVMPIKLEAEPENQISMEEVEVSGAQLDKYESKELEGAFTKISSQVISDSLSVSHSDCLDETNLNKVEKALNVAEDMSRKGESAAAMAKGSADPIVEKATEALITGDVFSAMSNTKNDFHLQNEENVSKCSRVSDDIESVAPDIMGTLVMDGHKNDVEHSENVRYSAPNISKSERNQDYEKLEEENEKLREIVEKLVEAEKLQMSTIAQLNDKIKHLESKLGKGKKTRKARAGPLRLRSNRGERNTKNAPTLRC